MQNQQFSNSQVSDFNGTTREEIIFQVGNVFFPERMFLRLPEEKKSGAKKFKKVTTYKVSNQWGRNRIEAGKTEWFEIEQGE